MEFMGRGGGGKREEPSFSREIQIALFVPRAFFTGLGETPF